MARTGDVEKALEVKSAVRDNMLAKANVIGVGVGPKITNGEETGDVALKVYVSKKGTSIPSTSDRVPKQAKGSSGAVKTDVVQLAPLRARGFTNRLRPGLGGCSGAVDVPGLTFTGTLGLAMRGYGAYEGRFFVLSNNHVLADENRSRIGDPVVQPGSLDGGKIPDDVIGHLFDYVPLQFPSPTDPRPVNHVDAALAEVNFGSFSREVFWVGYPKGWRDRRHVYAELIGNGAVPVQKTGRTTSYTQGEITDVSFEGWIGYSTGPAWFEDQLLIEPGTFSDAGDSGSCILDLDEHIVGLLFAGGATHTIANPIDDVWLNLPPVDFSDFRVI